MAVQYYNKNRVILKKITLTNLLYVLAATALCCTMLICNNALFGKFDITRSLRASFQSLMALLFIYQLAGSVIRFRANKVSARIAIVCTLYNTWKNYNNSNTVIQ